MRFYLIVFLASTTSFLFAQEMESDLYSSMNSSSLSIFMKTELYNTMSVVTYRASKTEGMVEEHSTTYRKGKINPERINFTTTYTDFFILEDRKKSLGKYEFNADFDVLRYERSDFDSRNARTYTFYHYYIYSSSVLQRENIRTKEYLGTGSVEQDTVVTRDSALYEVTAIENGYRQKDLSAGGATTDFILENGKLVKEISTLTGFSEETVFIYDANGRLVKIENTLIGEDGQRIKTYTTIRYSIDGLMTEALFYDQNDEVLEKKVFTYK